MLGAGIDRADGHKELAEAKSTWDSEGGAADPRTTQVGASNGPLMPRAH
ncbi:hypothetical protein MMEU_0635 [Mycobacterium marinum str. Europe]|nr:hypothetical protein MMEU_0635 [Mycobacterium marinum str. Europe]